MEQNLVGLATFCNDADKRNKSLLAGCMILSSLRAIVHYCLRILHAKTNGIVRVLNVLSFRSRSATTKQHLNT